MSEKSIVICDEDLRYANALAENILEREELNVTVFTFSSQEKCSCFFQKNQADIWIMDEKFWKKDNENNAEIFVLTKGEPPKEIEKEKVIYKYQSADEIIKRVLEYYVNKTKENVVKGLRTKHTKLEAVFSPVRGIGKTRFAIALGKSYAKSEKILYLNMETFAGFEECPLDESRTNLGDLIYYLKKNEMNFGLQLQNALEKIGNFFYVCPVYVAEDLRGVSKEEWILLLQKLQNLGWYDRIIVDVDEGISGLFSVLQLCDKIFLPTREDNIAEQKIRRYEICIERLGFGDLEKKTRRFVMKEQLEECIREQIGEDG